MNKLKLIMALSCAILTTPAMAQTRLNSVNGPGPTFAYPGMTYSSGQNTYYRGVTPYNTPYGYGYGGYGGYPGAVYGIPTVLNNGFYRFNMGPAALNMWRSPSGYYYPWGGGGYSTSTTILYAPQATTAPQAQQPPIATMVRDMLSYIDESKEKKRLDDGDYNHLRQRIVDLQSKESLLMSNGNGSLDPQDEQQLRADLDSVSREITQRIKPVN